jgi:hypothetical protein
VKPSPVRVKVPMVAMTVSCLSIGPRPSRPRWRSSGRGRAPTHSAGAAAQRRTGLGDFLASRGMRGTRRGRKLHRRRCGRGARGVSRPSARSGHPRQRGSATPDGPRSQQATVAAPGTSAMNEASRSRRQWRAQRRGRPDRGRRNAGPVAHPAGWVGRGVDVPDEGRSLSDQPRDPDDGAGRRAVEGDGRRG